MGKCGFRAWHSQIHRNPTQPPKIPAELMEQNLPWKLLLWGHEGGCPQPRGHPSPLNTHPHPAETTGHPLTMTLAGLNPPSLGQILAPFLAIS